MATVELESFVDRSVRRGLYRLREDNLHVHVFVDAPRTEVVLCHEGDIHVSTVTDSLFDAVRDAWTDAEYDVVI